MSYYIEAQVRLFGGFSCEYICFYFGVFNLAFVRLSDFTMFVLGVSKQLHERILCQITALYVLKVTIDFIWEYVCAFSHLMQNS